MNGTVDVADELVWDIGGGSMQITTCVNGKTVVCCSEASSVNFANAVINLKKSYAAEKYVAGTPNPISDEFFGHVFQSATDIAAKLITDPVEHKRLGKLTATGIGQMHKSTKDYISLLL